MNNEALEAGFAGAIAVVKQRTEILQEFTMLAFLCFVNVHKVFDSIQISDVVKLPLGKGVPHRITKLTINIYTDNQVDTV